MKFTVRRFPLWMWRSFVRPQMWGIERMEGGGRLETRCASWLWFVVNIPSTGRRP